MGTFLWNLAAVSVQLLERTAHAQLAVEDLGLLLSEL